MVFKRYVIPEQLRPTTKIGPATTATMLWETWSSLAQIITPTTIEYLGNASSLNDSEVEAMMERNDAQSTSIRVGGPPPATESTADLTKLLPYTSFYQRSNSGQGTVTSHTRLGSVSTVSVTELTALAVGVTAVPSPNSDKDQVSSPNSV
jgi:hypothetical protein